ncbi:MAG: type II toxin-antitoxin system Phd/YefM family antitoxin [Myxococcales bacterium]|nr:type II toxin-antitoxin system Phd/YefM family antitoxin [Myxococcales bacterium]
MSSYSIGAARNEFSALVHEAEGTPVEITRNGEPVAVLVSIAQFRRLMGQGNFGDLLKRFRREHLADLDDDLFPVEVRDRSPGPPVKLG